MTRGKIALIQTTLLKETSEQPQVNNMFTNDARNPNCANKRGNLITWKTRTISQGIKRTVQRELEEQINYHIYHKQTLTF